MADLTVCIGVERLAEPVTGEWCPRCLLPSAVAYTMALSLNHEMNGVLTFRGCTDCGWTERR